MYQAMDFFQFQKRFATEPRCRAYLIKQRWPEGFTCPKCQHPYGYFIQSRASFQCQRCRYQSVGDRGHGFPQNQNPAAKMVLDDLSTFTK